MLFRGKLGLLLIFFLVPALSPSRLLAADTSVEILIAAAASLAPYCTAMGERFEAQSSGLRVRFNFASSGQLRQQIEAGAPVDGFISASTRQMEMLGRKGLIRESTLQVLARNRLVLIVPAQGAPSAVRGFSDLAGPSVVHVALGDPSHVPAGYYGRAVLEHLGLWESLRPKLVYGLNVRQVLEYVIQGEVDAGLVYLSDARTAGERVRKVAVAPDGSHPRITYPMAVLSDASHPDEAAVFFAFLLTDSSQRALSDYGLQSSLEKLSRRDKGARP